MRLITLSVALSLIGGISTMLSGCMEDALVIDCRGTLQKRVLIENLLPKVERLYFEGVQNYNVPYYRIPRVQYLSFGRASTIKCEAVREYIERGVHVLINDRLCVMKTTKTQVSKTKSITCTTKQECFL